MGKTAWRSKKKWWAVESSKEVVGWEGGELRGPSGELRAGPTAGIVVSKQTDKEWPASTAIERHAGRKQTVVRIKELGVRL